MQNCKIVYSANAQRATHVAIHEAMKSKDYTAVPWDNNITLESLVAFGMMDTVVIHDIPSGKEVIDLKYLYKNLNPTWTLIMAVKINYKRLDHWVFNRDANSIDADDHQTLD